MDSSFAGTGIGIVPGETLSLRGACEFVASLIEDAVFETTSEREVPGKRSAMWKMTKMNTTTNTAMMPPLPLIILKSSQLPNSTSWEQQQQQQQQQQQYTVAGGFRPGATRSCATNDHASEREDSEGK